jgi:hypothetical protein
MVPENHRRKCEISAPYRVEAELDLLSRESLAGPSDNMVSMSELVSHSDPALNLPSWSGTWLLGVNVAFDNEPAMLWRCLFRLHASTSVEQKRSCGLGCERGREI